MNRKSYSNRRAEAMRRIIVDWGTKTHIAWLEGQYNGLTTIGIARALAKAFDRAASDVLIEYKASYAPPRKPKPVLVAKRA